MLGEEEWISQRPRDVAMAVNVAATAFGAAALLSARRRWLPGAAGATAGQMTLLLVYWELMVRYHAQVDSADESDHSSSSQMPYTQSI